MRYILYYLDIYLIAISLNAWIADMHLKWFHWSGVGVYIYIYIYMRSARWAFMVYTVYRVLLIYMHMRIYMYVYMIALVQTA